MAASNNETEDRRLGDIFNEAYNLYYDFEKSQLATNSAEFQVTHDYFLQLCKLNLFVFTPMFSWK